MTGPPRAREAELEAEIARLHAEVARLQSTATAVTGTHERELATSKIMNLDLTDCVKKWTRA